MNERSLPCKPSGGQKKILSKTAADEMVTTYNKVKVGVEAYQWVCKFCHYIHIGFRKVTPSMPVTPNWKPGWSDPADPDAAAEIKVKLNNILS